MNKKICFLILTMSAIASGCAADKAVSRADRSSGKICSDFGLQRGTDAYAGCLARQTAQNVYAQRISDPTGKDYEAAKRMRKW